MKLTPNEEQKICYDVISKMLFQDEVTGREMGLYLKMRGNAFYDHKKKKRNPCMKGAKVLSNELGANIKKIQPRLKSLEKKGLIKPKYFIVIAGKIKGFTDISFIEENFSMRSIKYVEYKINLLPGEKEARKLYKQNKRKK